MKIIVLHHRLNEWAHDRVNNLAHNRNGGSIMIWTVMLGLLLTSVFFFFSMRQRMMIAVQRDTAAQQSAKMFVDSYADYLQKNPTEIGEEREKYYGRPTIDGIYTKLTKRVDSIESSVDSGLGQEQDYNFTGSIYVEWNKCTKVGPQDSSGDLRVNDVLYPHQTTTGCEAKDEYDDVVGPLSVSGTTSTPFTIKTLNTPFFFRIKGAAGTTAYDNQWHMELTKDLDYGKVITVRRTFK